MNESQIEGGCDISHTHPWTVTLFSGRTVDVSRLCPEDVTIEDIAHALAMQCRFNGHCKRHYSIAQHSVLVSSGVCMSTRDPRATLVGLLHDGSEAYIQDIVRGCKRQMPAYISLEKAVQDTVFKRFGLTDHAKYHDIVKEWDNRVLKVEARSLITGGGSDWVGFDLIEPAPFEIENWSPEAAEAAFLGSSRNLLESIKC